MMLQRFAWFVLSTSTAACAGSDPPTLDAAASATADPGIGVKPPKVPLPTRVFSEATRYPPTSALSPVTPSVAERLRRIASRDASRRNDAFIKVGDSHIVSGNFLHCFAKVEAPVELAKNVDYFRGSFERESLATLSGKTAGWAISGHPSPLERELRAKNPRFAFVSFGSNDMEAGRNYGTAIHSFHDNLSTLLDQLENAGVVPILSGLPPRGRRIAKPWTGVYDALTRGIAESRQIPYFSVYVANQALPDQGLVSDRLHENVFVRGVRQPCNFNPEALTRGYNLRNLRSMQQLDLVKRILVDGASAPDAAPSSFDGDGSTAHPWVIDALPFTHSADSSRGERLPERHVGCGVARDQPGPAVSYRLTLDRPTAVRFLVFDRGGVDVDLHVQSSKNACGDHSIMRVLPAGTHTVVVAGSRGGSGPYLFLASRCEPGDVDCQ